MPIFDYKRYDILKNTNGTTDMMPFIKIPELTTDKYEMWNSYNMRFDKLAQKYYNNPFYDFLIIYANPQFLSEWDVEEDALIRIPFPLETVLNYYENELTRIKQS